MKWGSERPEMVSLFHSFTHSLRVLQMPHEKIQLLLWNKGARASQGSHGLKCKECIPHNLLPSEFLGTLKEHQYNTLMSSETHQRGCLVVQG